MKALFAIFIYLFFQLPSIAQNNWVQRADFSEPRDEAIALSIAGKGYVGTGWNGSNYNRDWWEFDPATNQWTRKADFPGVARTKAVAFSIGDKGYVGGGGNDSGVLSDFWEYNPPSDAWTQKANLTMLRPDLVSATRDMSEPGTAIS